MREIEEEDTSDLSPRRTALKREQALRVSGGKKMKLDVEMPPPPEKEFSKSEEQGVLTRAITAGESRAHSEVGATVRFGLRKKNAIITSLGLRTLFASTTFAPSEKEGSKATIRFELRVRGGMAGLKLAATATAIHDGRGGQPAGYEMRINKMDEGEHPGVFHAYVRWLTFRAISGQGK